MKEYIESEIHSIFEQESVQFYNSNIALYSNRGISMERTSYIR